MLQQTKRTKKRSVMVHSKYKKIFKNSPNARCCFERFKFIVNCIGGVAP